jgi:regulator of nucleoside diphosphate kinase
MKHVEQLPPITVCEEDRDRLDALISTYRDDLVSEMVERLASELDRADVVESEQLPTGVVRMNSRVMIRDLDTGELRSFDLVYPADANPRVRRVSVFSPAGCAVLGLAEGQRISWPVARHRNWRIEVVSVRPSGSH